jgi:hypothetical protein
MTDHEEGSSKATDRQEKRIAEEAEQLAKEQVRNKTYFAREQVIEAGQRANEARRSEKRASEGIEQSAKDRARSEAYLTREKALAEAEEVRKLKEKSKHPDTPGYTNFPLSNP